MNHQNRFGPFYDRPIVEWFAENTAMKRDTYIWKEDFHVRNIWKNYYVLIKEPIELIFEFNLKTITPKINWNEYN